MFLKQRSDRFKQIEDNTIKYFFCLHFPDPRIWQLVNICFSTQLYSKTPRETLESRKSLYLVWLLCINIQFSIEEFYIQVQLSDCDECLTSPHQNAPQKIK